MGSPFEEFGTQIQGNLGSNQRFTLDYFYPIHGFLQLRLRFLSAACLSLRRTGKLPAEEVFLDCGGNTSAGGLKNRRRLTTSCIPSNRSPDKT